MRADFVGLCGKGKMARLGGSLDLPGWFAAPGTAGTLTARVHESSVPMDLRVGGAAMRYGWPCFRAPC
jgi:hypothetical protein